MKFNNIWINHEDEIFVRFTCILNLAKNSYIDVIAQLNRAFHEITYRHELLMTLSPEYCKHYALNYEDHYYNYLDSQNKLTEFFPSDGYEFYKKDTSRVSKIFFKDQAGELTSSYVHYILNGPSGNPICLPNDKDTRMNLETSQFFYDASPLSILYPTYVQEDADGKNVTVSFSIESHCSFWLDFTSMFKYTDKNNEAQCLNYTDNRLIAYANTPRLNSFFRDIRRSVQEYDGQCYLYDHKSFLSNNNPNIQTEALERMGLTLDGRIIYQEDIDEGQIEMSVINDSPV